MLSRLLSFLLRLLSRVLSTLNTSESSDTSHSDQQSSHESSNNQSWINSDTFQRAAGIGNRQAERWYPHVRAACIEYDITTPERIAAWIAQVSHESGGFVYTREIW